MKSKFTRRLLIEASRADQLRLQLETRLNTRELNLEEKKLRVLEGDLFTLDPEDPDDEPLLNTFKRLDLDPSDRWNWRILAELFCRAWLPTPTKGATKWTWDEYELLSGFAAEAEARLPEEKKGDISAICEVLEKHWYYRAKWSKKKGSAFETLRKRLGHLRSGKVKDVRKWDFSVLYRQDR